MVATGFAYFAGRAAAGDDSVLFTVGEVFQVPTWPACCT